MDNLAKLITQPEKKARLWEGIVRFMDANGKKTVEIGIEDAREVAAMMRSKADGR